MPDPALLLGGLPATVLPVVALAVLAVEATWPVGFLVPGTTVALTAGALAGAAGTPFAAVAAGTAAGAVLGGQIGYRAGRRSRRERVGPVPRPLLTVGVGPWLSVGRVLVPRLAGRAGLGHRWFTLVHGASASAWATALTVVGHLGGAAVRDDVAGALAAAAAVAVVAVLVTVARRHCSAQLRHRSGPLRWSA